MSKLAEEVPLDELVNRSYLIRYITNTFSYFKLVEERIGREESLLISNLISCK